jgi:hypothetical protein
MSAVRLKVMAGSREKTVSGLKYRSMRGLADEARARGVPVSKRKLQRWELDGRIPKPELLITKSGGFGGAERWYNPSEVEAVIATVAGQRQQDATPTLRSWGEVEKRPPVTVERWENLQGGRSDTYADYSGLPDHCKTCGRKAIGSSTQDSYGRRWLLATCPGNHGVLGRKPWPMRQAVR